MDWAATDNQNDPQKMDWAASPTKTGYTPSKLRTENDHSSLLPNIPPVFDDDFDEPKPVTIQNNDGTIAKYTWKIIADPKAAEDNEFPDLVCIQTKEHMQVSRQKVNKNVAFRRTWTKYGSAKNDGVGCGAETQVTSEDNAVPIVLFNRKNMISHQQVTLTESEEKELLDTRRTILVNIKQNKLTPDKVPLQWGAKEMAGDVGQSFMDKVRDAQGGGPVSALIRPGGEGLPSRPGRPGRDNQVQEEGCTVRVTNLSENVVDGDIQDLFGTVGRIRRLYMAKHKNTSKCKGYAFVTYESKQTAEKAIAALHKYAYDHLILNVEISKNEKKN